ncbi:hypothetical protein [Cellulomonas sp. HZM]|uniref:hypothetical protein n=1 Tax=Cellulomonas sp. HZM TaxID=1454010 RepID=UPI000493B167|nr:hypothetical protein [Cellulomonas sp. HZM]
MSAQPGQPDEVTLAVLAARMDDVREDIRGMRTDLSAHRAELVSRGEWEQRNRAVDARFQEQGREISTLRTSLETKTTALDARVTAADNKADARRAPWWAVGALVVSAAALLVTLVPLIARP